VLSLAFVGFALFFLGGYGWFVWDEAAHGVVATAVVTQAEAVKGGTDLYITFVLPDGAATAADFIANRGTAAWYDGVGSTLAVRYVPRDPRNVRAADEPVSDSAFFVIGGVTLVVGTGLAVYAWFFMPARPS
jgi:hypothetical protein